MMKSPQPEEESVLLDQCLPYQGSAGTCHATFIYHTPSSQDNSQVRTLSKRIRKKKLYNEQEYDTLQLKAARKRKTPRRDRPRTTQSLAPSRDSQPQTRKSSLIDMLYDCCVKAEQHNNQEHTIKQDYTIKDDQTIIEHPPSPILNQPPSPILNQPPSPIIEQPPSPILNQPPSPMVEQPACLALDVPVPTTSLPPPKECPPLEL